MSDLVELLGEDLHSHDGNVATSVLYDKRYVAFYFAASWEPSCQSFTPKLVDFYNQVNEEEENAFEVVFVSSDDTEEAFDAHFGQMPWLTIPFDKEVFANLFTSYEVELLPSQIMVRRDCDIVSRHLKNDIEYKGFEAFEYMKTQFSSPTKNNY